MLVIEVAVVKLLYNSYNYNYLDDLLFFYVSSVGTNVLLQYIYRSCKICSCLQHIYHFTWVTRKVKVCRRTQWSSSGL